MALGMSLGPVALRTGASGNEKLENVSGIFNKVLDCIVCCLWHAKSWSTYFPRSTWSVD